VGVAKSGQHRLAGSGSPIDTESRGLLDHLLEGGRQFLLVVLAVGADRHLCHRPRIRDRCKLQGRPGAKGVSCPYVLGFGQRRDLACHQFPGVVMVFAELIEEIVRPHLAAAGEVELHVGFDPARVEAEE